jgi:hypothetical protein
VRSRRGWLIGGGVLLALFAALLLATAFLPEATDRVDGSLTNPRAAGVRALGQVLRAQGVEVSQVTTLAEATAAPAGATLAVRFSGNLSDAALDALAEVPADLVVVVAGPWYDAADLGRLTDGSLEVDSFWADDDAPVADCDDADALAAGTLTAGETGLLGYGPGYRTCFPDEEGATLYADGRTARHRVTVVAGTAWLRNDTITDEGNAALALRVFGRHDTLVWYLPGADAAPGQQSSGDELASLWLLLPGWSRPVAAVLVVAAAAAALWRGRRFGALVREPLPVEVPASEAATGLSRLYRQSGARGHAAAGLRAATILRFAGRLGLPPSAGPALVLERVAAATSIPPSQLQELLYGPAPTTDSALVELAARLSDLAGRVDPRD